MKNLKYIIFAVVAMFAMSMTAATKKKAKKAPAVEVKVDTISAHDFSYLIGKANTMGLKNYLAQRLGIDTAFIADFVKGFDAANMTEADKRMKARLAGLEIREQVEQQIIPQMEKQIDDSLKVLDSKLFLSGFRAGISGENDLIPISMDSTQAVVRKQMTYYNNVRMERKYGANRKAGEEFLKENGKKKDVVTTKSGLQYKVLVKGEGEIPTATQRVKVNYEGHLIDGTEFDSSYKRNEPTTFACNQVIKGWTEALTLMPVGSKWELYIPQELAYGDRESGKIPPYSTLIFTVELLSIEK